MGSSQNTSTSTTRPLNAHVSSTANNLLGGIDAAWARGPSTFNESLYTGLGNTTNRGLTSLIGSANNPTYSNGVQGAIGYNAGLANGSGPSLTESTLMRTAQGGNFGTNDPGYATLRNKLSNDVLTSTNGSFNNSGLFGSDNNQKQAASGLADSLGGLDYQNYQSDVARQQQALSAIEGTRQQGVNNAFTAQSALPGLYQASQQPASTLLTAGAIQDADAQARQQGRYDLSTRQGNAQTDLLGRLSSIFNGTSGSGGSQTTSSTPGTPWWQTVGQLAVGAF